MSFTVLCYECISGIKLCYCVNLILVVAFKIFPLLLVTYEKFENKMFFSLNNKKQPAVPTTGNFPWQGS